MKKMKTIEEWIARLNDKGYTIYVEAKGRGREFEMTYEIFAVKKTKDLKNMETLISFGETLEGALESIERQIDALESVESGME